jgi:hypothetical protein
MRQQILAGVARSGLPAGHRGLYDVFVALHVTFALVGFASVALSGAYGVIGRRGYSSELRRYLGGRNWAPMGVLIAPLFGVAAMSVRPGGAEFTQLWAIFGLCVWLLAGTLLLGVLRPTERKLRELVGEGAMYEAPILEPSESQDAPGPGLLRVYANRLAWVGAISDLLFLAALLMMVTQPP